MSVRLRETLMGQLGTLRHEPTDTRIRAELGDRTVVDSTRALLVWEPKRVAFFNERVDVFVDGERQERPITPWSRR